MRPWGRAACGLALVLTSVAAPAGAVVSQRSTPSPALLGTEVTPVGPTVLRHLADGSVAAFGEIANRTSVPLRITRRFAVAFVDAGGAVIGTVTNADGRAFAERTVLAVGETAVWHATSAGPLPDAVTARVSVPSAIASTALPDQAFTASQVTVAAAGDGAERIHARITSHDPRDQAQVTAHLVLVDADGALIGCDQAVVGSGSLAPGASADLLVTRPLLPGEPIAARVLVTVDAQPVESVATQLDPHIPLRGRLVAGNLVTASPRLLRANGAPLAGKRLSWRERRPGGAMRELAHGVTDAHGIATMTVRLQTGTVVQVVYPGDATAFGTSSGDLVLGVRPALVAKIPDAASGPLFVQGTLRPGRPGAVVQLQRETGQHWVSVTSATVTRDGRFSLRASLPTGRQTVRAWVPAAGLVPATATAPVVVLVR